MAKYIFKTALKMIACLKIKHTIAINNTVGYISLVILILLIGKNKWRKKAKQKRVTNPQ